MRGGSAAERTARNARTGRDARSAANSKKQGGFSRGRPVLILECGRGARGGIDLKLSGSGVKTDCPLLPNRNGEKAAQRAKGEQLGEKESGKESAREKPKGEGGLRSVSGAAPRPLWVFLSHLRPAAGSAGIQ